MRVFQRRKDGNRQKACSLRDFFFTVQWLATYNPALMSNRLPVEVDPFRLIEQRRQLSGIIPLSQLPRVKALAVLDGESVLHEFQVNLEFQRSDSGLPMISGRVQGVVPVQCQRCLGAVTIDVDSTVNVVLTTSEIDRQPEEQGYELYIVTDERLFLQDFIEDEILLALPLVARHDTCSAAKELTEVLPREMAQLEQAGQSDGQTQDTGHEDVQDNPFAVLKDWKKE